MKTKCTIKMIWRDYGPVTIPKGTRVTNMTACGIDNGVFFIDDLSWVPPYPDGTKRHGFIHDATYYGISIPRETVDLELNNG